MNFTCVAGEHAARSAEDAADISMTAMVKRTAILANMSDPPWQTYCPNLGDYSSVWER